MYLSLSMCLEGIVILASDIRVIHFFLVIRKEAIITKNYNQMIRQFNSYRIHIQMECLN